MPLVSPIFKRNRTGIARYDEMSGMIRTQVFLKRQCIQPVAINTLVILNPPSDLAESEAAIKKFCRIPFSHFQQEAVVAVMSGILGK